MNARKRAVSRRGFIVGAGAAVTAAGIGRPTAAAVAAPAVVHFQADGGISSSSLASQLAGHGQHGHHGRARLSGAC